MKWRSKIAHDTQRLSLMLCCAMLLISSSAFAQRKTTLKLPEPGLPQPNKDSSRVVLVITTKQYPVVWARVSLMMDEVNPVVTRQHCIASEISKGNGKLVFKVPDDPELRDKLWIQITHPYLQTVRYRFDKVAANDFKCIVEEKLIYECLYRYVQACPRVRDIPDFSEQCSLKNPDQTPLPQILKNMGYY